MDNVSLQLQQFLAANSPFLPRPVNQLVTQTTTTSGLAWGARRPEFRAKVAVPDPHLLQRLGEALDRELETLQMPQASFNAFVNEFLVRRNAILRDPPLSNESSTVDVMRDVMQLVFALLQAYNKSYTYGREVYKSSQRPDYQYKTPANSQLYRVVGEYKKAAVLQSWVEGLQNPHVVEFSPSSVDTAEKKIFRQCATGLAILGSEWSFVTSYSCWSFMKFVRMGTYPGIQEAAYIAYSQPVLVGNTQHDTDVFRALIALHLCSNLQLDAVRPAPHRGKDEAATGTDRGRGLPRAPPPPPADDDGNGGGPRRNARRKVAAARGPGASRGGRTVKSMGSRVRKIKGRRVPLRDETLNFYFDQYEAIENCEPTTGFLLDTRFAFLISKNVQATRLIGSGMHAEVWEAYVHDDSYNIALKTVSEGIHNEDDFRALNNEADVYIRLEEAIEAETAPAIAPRFLGMYKVDTIEMLAIELHREALEDWSELTNAEKDDVFKLVMHLHNIGVSHNDLQPSNVVRCRDGGFRLIDFSMARVHPCADKARFKPAALKRKIQPVMQFNCNELERLREMLWK